MNVKVMNVTTQGSLISIHKTSWDPKNSKVKETNSYHWYINIHLLIIELDAKAVVDVFLNPSYQNNAISPILDDCRELMLQFQQVQLRHCFRQANCCADVLARMSTDQDAEFISFSCPPVDIRSMLDEDAIGLYVNRVCFVSDVPG